MSVWALVGQAPPAIAISLSRVVHWTTDLQTPDASSTTTRSSHLTSSFCLHRHASFLVRSLRLVRILVTCSCKILLSPLAPSYNLCLPLAARLTPVKQVRVKPHESSSRNRAQSRKPGCFNPPSSLDPEGLTPPNIPVYSEALAPNFWLWLSRWLLAPSRSPRPRCFFFFSLSRPGQCCLASRPSLAPARILSHDDSRQERVSSSFSRARVQHHSFFSSLSRRSLVLST